MSIGLEWILSAVIAIVGALLGVIWATLNNKIKELGEADDAAKQHCRNEFEKAETHSKERFADVWGHINNLRDDTVEIKEFRGSLTSKIENLKRQIADLPSYKDFAAMFRESEERIEARLIALVGNVARGGK
jgi:polyhydroxyalkanoate synthesis regulator phasin